MRPPSGAGGSRSDRVAFNGAKSSGEPVFVIEVTDEPPRFAQPFRVAPAGRDYDDDLDLISGLIFIEKPEPLHPIVVRPAPGAHLRPRPTAGAKRPAVGAKRPGDAESAGDSIHASARAPKPGQVTSSNTFGAHVAAAETAPRATAANSGQKPFSFVALVGDRVAASAPTPAGSRPKPGSNAKQSMAKQPSARSTSPDPARPDKARQAKATPNTAGQATERSRTSAPTRSRSRSADSVVYRRDDSPGGTKRVATARQKRPALSIRTVEDPVERLLIDHEDLQLSHYGPIVVESSLWPPDMRIDSVNEHMQNLRWPREESVEVWIRLPQICEALWDELARTDLVSGSTVETWITNSDVDDRILHQMRLSIRVDDAESPRELLRVYRAQAEEFVGYGLDGIISRPADRR